MSFEVRQGLGLSFVVLAFALVVGGRAWRRAGEPAADALVPSLEADGFAARERDVPHDLASTGAPSRSPLAPALDDPRHATEPQPPAPAVFAEGTGSVQVRVLPCADTAADGLSGSLVPWGASDPRLGTRVFRTGPQGACTIDALVPGPFTVALDVGGSAEGTVRASERSEALIDLRQGLRVRGVVLDAAGAAVPGASVWLSRPMDASQAEIVASADSHGRFQLPCVLGGGFLVARAPAHAPSSSRWLLGNSTPDEEAFYELVLTGTGASLRVVVQGRDGLPVPDARVEARESGSAAWRAVNVAGRLTPLVARTDERGHARLEGLEPTRVAVRVRAPGRAPWAGHVDLAAEATRRVDVVLEAGVRIQGSVLDSDGARVSGARVAARAAGGAWSAFTSASKDGTFALENLGAGTIFLDADAGEVGSARATLHAEPGSEVRSDLRLARGAPLRGRVADLAGRPLAFWRVEAVAGAPEHPWRAETMSAPDGTFAIDGVPGASATLHVRAAHTLRTRPERDLPVATLREVTLPGPELDVRLAPPSAFLELSLAACAPERADAYVHLHQVASGLEVALPLVPGDELRLGPLAAGTYRLRVETDEPTSAPIDLGEQTLIPNETLHLDAVR